MATPTNFYLASLNQTITATAALVENVTLAVPSTDATVEIAVSLSDFRNLFQYHADAVDVNDTDPDDIFYYTYPSYWPNPNPVTSTVTTGRIPVNNRATSTTAQDFVGYLAKILFGNANMVDLFNNESTLLSDLGTKGDTANTNIFTYLTSIGISGDHLNLQGPDTSGHLYFTNSEAIPNTGDNIVRALMGAMMADTSDNRFTDTSGDNLSPEGHFQLPFVTNDIVSFMLTVKPAADQQSFIASGAPVPDRTYLIKLKMSNA